MLRRIAIALIPLSVLACSRTTREIATTNPLGNPPGMVDRLIMFDSAEDWGAGESERLVASGDALVLNDDRERAFPRTGSWTSPAIETDFAFTELLPSWNLLAPPSTGARFEIRVRDSRRGTWSPWLHMGLWGDVTLRPDRVVEFEGGVVNVDVVNLTRPADAFQIRANLQSLTPDHDINPTLRRISAAYSGVVKDEDDRAALMPPVNSLGDAVRLLEIPHICQGDLGRPLSGLCCSPTSLTMVLNAFGDATTLEANSMEVFDPEYSIFGNWGRAVALAGSRGFDAWLTRIRTWDQAKALIAQGQPIIASVSIDEGDITGLDYSGGHLVVIRGFTPEGDPIINDPAYSERGEASVWAAEEMAIVWFEHGGVAYIIRPAQ